MNIYIQANTKIKATSKSVKRYALDFSRLTFKIIGCNGAASVVEIMNCFAVLDPLIKTFIQVSLVIGPLSLVGVVLILRKIEKDHPERIRWK